MLDAVNSGNLPPGRVVRDFSKPPILLAKVGAERNKKVVCCTDCSLRLFI
jgi:hypothetical protein